MVKIKGDRSMFIYLAIIDSPEGKLKFEVIYERYKGLMFYTANSVLGDTRDSEDRNGVETVPANIRKNYRLDKLPRGKQRAKFFFGSKIAALNFRKLFGFRKGLVNYAQNPIFG